MVYNTLQPLRTGTLVSMRSCLNVFSSFLPLLPQAWPRRQLKVVISLRRFMIGNTSPKYFFSSNRHFETCAPSSFRKYFATHNSVKLCPEELKSTFNYCDMPSQIRSKEPRLSRFSGSKSNVWAYTLYLVRRPRRRWSRPRLRRVAAAAHRSQTVPDAREACTSVQARLARVSSRPVSGLLV